MTAPWSPMAAPPLPCRNDDEVDTCEHAYPRESCHGVNGWHDPDPIETLILGFIGSRIIMPPATFLVMDGPS